MISGFNHYSGDIPISVYKYFEENKKPLILTLRNKVLIFQYIDGYYRYDNLVLKRDGDVYKVTEESEFSGLYLHAWEAEGDGTVRLYLSGLRNTQRVKDIPTGTYIPIRELEDPSYYGYGIFYNDNTINERIRISVKVFNFDNPNWVSGEIYYAGLDSGNGKFYGTFIAVHQSGGISITETYKI